MKNEFIDGFRNIITVKICGRNTDNFVRKIMNKKITILNIKYLSSKEIRIKIYLNDYDKILKYKTTYDVKIYKYHGLLKIKEIIKRQKIFLIFMILGFIILFFISNIISDIEIIHTNNEIRVMVKDILKEKGIKKNSFKKNKKKIDKIKKEILYKYKDKIEWLEIENIGTKYIIRLEQRKIKKQEKEEEKNDIVSSKDAIIRKIESQSGISLKNVNDHVAKGDIIISGNVMLGEELKDIIDAKGKVYGEVWYKVRVTYPYIYVEETLTGKENEVFALNFINKKIELFNNNKYKNKKSTKKIFLKNNIIPISFTKEYQKEVKVTKQINTEADAVNSAKEIARNKIKKSLGVNEYIISEKNLKVTAKDSKIEIDMFFSVYENITMKKPVEIIELENEKENIEKRP